MIGVAPPIRQMHPLVDGFEELAEHLPCVRDIGKCRHELLIALAVEPAMAAIDSGEILVAHGDLRVRNTDVLRGERLDRKWRRSWRRVTGRELLFDRRILFL